MDGAISGAFDKVPKNWILVCFQLLPVSLDVRLKVRRSICINLLKGVSHKPKKSKCTNPFNPKSCRI